MDLIPDHVNEPVFFSLQFCCAILSCDKCAELVRQTAGHRSVWENLAKNLEPLLCVVNSIYTSGSFLDTSSLKEFVVEWEDFEQMRLVEI